MNEEYSEDLNKLMLQKRENFEHNKEEGIKNFAPKYETTHHAEEIENNYEELEGEDVAIAGRLMALRTHGKASFADIMDMTGQIINWVKI